MAENPYEPGTLLRQVWEARAAVRRLGAVLLRSVPLRDGWQKPVAPPEASSRPVPPEVRPLRTHCSGCGARLIPGMELCPTCGLPWDHVDPREDPDERVLPRDVQVEVEEHLGAGFGLPEVWRCPCGGRPFITESTCPRCGRKQAERWS